MRAALAAVAVALAVALVVVVISAGDGEKPAPERAGGQRIEKIARAVERVRGLEFDHLPRVREVSAAEARRAGLREVDRSMPPREQRREERLLELLGLLPPEARLRELVGKVLTEQAAGYYVPRTGTLAVVRGGGIAGLFADVALAHELTHALEDQRFGVEPHGASGFLRDRATAEAALFEGSATLAMVEYVAVSRGAGQGLPSGVRRQLMERLGTLALPSSSGLPRYVREGLVFPYAAGARFVDRVQRRGGWAAVDRVFEQGGPASTEQVMHPRKYLAGERPVRVRLGGYRGELPAGARAVSRGDLGEFDTAQFLRDGNGRRGADRAAAGWEGSAFGLWRLPDGGDALVMGWAWDSARDAREFEAAARRRLRALRRPGAVRRGGDRLVAVVLAPEAGLARRIASAVSGGAGVAAAPTPSR